MLMEDTVRVLKRVWLKGVTHSAVLSALIATAAAPGTASAVTLDKVTDSTPALAVFNGKLFLAFKGTDGRLSVASSTDGLTFGTSTVLNNYSASGPGLAAFDGSLYIAWADTNSGNKINYMNSTDGVTWGNKTLFGDEVGDGSPALAGSSSQLLIAWNGTDSERKIHIGCIVCTSLSYGTKKVFSPGTEYDVGLAAINDNFFLVANRSDEVSILSSSAASPLSLNTQQSTDTTLRGPAIVGSDGFAYVGWVGSGYKLNLGQYQVSDTSIQPVSVSQTPENETSHEKPAVAVFNGAVYYAWKGADGHINIDQVN